MGFTPFTWDAWNSPWLRRQQLALSEMWLARKSKLCERGAGYTFFCSGQGSKERLKPVLALLRENYYLENLLCFWREMMISRWPWKSLEMTLKMSVPMYEPWPTWMKSNTDSMKNCILLLLLSPNLTSWLFLVTPMQEFEMSPGRRSLGNSGSAHTGAVVYFHCRHEQIINQINYQ